MSLKQKLDTPLKRTAFLVLSLSSIIFILSLTIKTNSKSYYEFPDVFIYSLIFDTRRSEFSFMVCISFYLSVISTIITFLYDSFVLKIIKWIKTGEKVKKANVDTLHFKDNISAFKYLCEFGNNEIIKKMC